MSALRHVVGLDLGKQADYSALALLEWQPQPPRRVYGPGGGPGLGSRPKLVPADPPEYAVPTLKRWPLGTPYLNIIDGVVKFLQTPPLSGGRPLLVLDATGVGEAVAEMVRAKLTEARVQGGFVAVCITAGSAVTHVGAGRWRVSKRQLVSVLQVLLGNRRLHVAPKLAEAPTLARELATFAAEITPDHNETFAAWREGEHDDLVLAVALATWAAESLDLDVKPPPRPTVLRA